MTRILIYFFIILQLYSNIVFCQRSFTNPAVSDPAPCACDLRANNCDSNCCCDPDCSDDDLRVSPVCQSVRTSRSSTLKEESLAKWNCSNTTTAALYDYFPFVCVQLSLTEVIGSYHSTENVQSIKSADDVTSLRSTFVTEYSELFQSSTLSSSVPTGGYTANSPVLQSSSTIFTLPGNLLGFTCQDNVPVVFGVNRDVYCTTTSNLCTQISSITSLNRNGSSTSTVPINFFAKAYTSTTTTATTSTQEYYFQNSYNLSITDTSSTTDTINDYCPGEHPVSRTQRYRFVCTATTGDPTCSNYQIWSGCPLRDSFQYSSINDTFFTARSSSTDDSITFTAYNSVTTISCPNNIRRVVYRFTYSSADNTISAVDAYVLYNPLSTTPRITIEWVDTADSTILSTNIPRGYFSNEALQFRRNSASSDVSALIPSANGLCIDATRQTLRYKQSTTSYCSIQLQRNTIQQGCHNLKLNLYLYLNVFFAPASHVLAYPNVNATTIKIRDDNQDLIDLDRIDVTRLNNRLTNDTITRSNFRIPGYTVYDTTQTLPICFNVPSGIYIEFGYVRINISSTLSYERIVSVQYNYTYSDWQFDCTSGSCDSTSTQQYLISFQSNFVDYTSRTLGLSDTKRIDITSADNYIEHLLWLITPEYLGEPGYRKYTIAMILIFTGICVIVMHVLLFGIMFPF
ncbi:hypothetical protein I4U23_028246 [Adineta vaga]|nr:hypothetical protein I4U23_028246 [Adineta vaga]